MSKKYPASFWQPYVAAMTLASTQKERRVIIKELIERTGYRKQAVYENLRKNNWESGKKERSDKGLNPELLTHIIEIEKIYHTPINAKDGTLTNMPLCLAIELYQRSLPKVDLPSTSRIGQILNMRKTTRKDAKLPKPFIRMKADYVNKVWQLDTSICLLYFSYDHNIEAMPKVNPKSTGKLEAMSNGTAYKNKPFAPDKRKKPLIRWGVLDFVSNAFFVFYSFQERAVDVADFLYKAFAKKDVGWLKSFLKWDFEGREDEMPQYVFHGLPDMLIMDNDKALRSHQMLRLFKYLKIEIPTVTPYHSRVKGAIERWMKWWEVHFESTLMMQPPTSLLELNRWSFLRSIELQTTRKVGRHRHTRFAYWDKGIIKENLKEVPDFKTYQTLFHSDPESRTVDGNGAISFKGETYKLKGILNTKVDVTVQPFLYQDNKAIIVEYPSRELNQRNYTTNERQTVIVYPTALNKHGFGADAVEWGTYREADTDLRTENITSIEGAHAKGDVPKVRPYDGLEERAKEVIFIPKTGTQVSPVSLISIPERTFNFIQMKKRVIESMGKTLNTEDIKYLNSNKKEQYTEADIEAFINELSKPIQLIGGNSA
jgi:hypothetical protein